MAPAATPPTPPLATFQIGDQVGHSKQYEIKRLLGRGGFGEVYLAWEERAHRNVAIKTMLPKLNGNKKNLRRFKAEYTLGALLSHPSLVFMWDFCESPEGVYYIVMEYIEGETLAQQMFREEKAHGQVGLATLNQVGWQLSSLFEQLHARGLVHRDLKPGNVMAVKDSAVTGGIRYKLLDFGIAKVVDPAQAEAMSVVMNTTEGMFMGTPELMSPESIKGSQYQGPATDVYCLGCMLYRCVAGNYPFEAKDPVEVIRQHIQNQPIPLTSEDPLIARDLADLIHAMMDKDPAKRPTMKQVSEFFARRLGLAAGGLAQVVISGGSSELQAVLGEVSTNGAIAQTASAPISLQVLQGSSVQDGQVLALADAGASARRRKLMVGFVVGGLAFSAGSAVLLLRTDRADRHISGAGNTLDATSCPVDTTCGQSRGL